MSIEISNFWLGFGLGLLVMFLFITVLSYMFSRKHTELEI
jgi:hypothetical protein